MPYVLIDDAQLKEFDPEGKLSTIPEDKIEKLEAKANELLGEKKKQQLKFEEAELEYKRKISELHESKGGEDTAKIQSMLDSALDKNKEWESKYTDLQTSVKRKDIESTASQLAAELTRDNKRANLLKEKIASRIDKEGDNVVVLDSNGNPTVSTTNDLLAAMRTDYDFLCDGSKASGGGANGGSGGASPTKKFNEYNSAELKEIKDTNPEQYQQLRNDFYNQ